MTTEAWIVTPQYTVAGIGPYAITHPFAQDAIRVFVVVSGEWVQLTLADYSLTPIESATTGNLFLTPAAATTHAGRALIIDRQTPDEQGWLGVQGEREAGLEMQLDQIVQAQQELRAAVAGAARIRGILAPFDWTEGTVPVRQGDSVVSGPTTAEITAAAAAAASALASAAAAAASAAEALAKENSMLRDRGNWATAILYAPSDIVTINGSAYICTVSHIAGVFATDLAFPRWRLFAAKGDAGSGSGDMLKSENLSGLANVGLARANLSLAIGANVQAWNAKLDQLAAPAYVRGDIIRRGAAQLERLALGVQDKVLVSNGTDAIWGPTLKAPGTAPVFGARAWVVLTGATGAMVSNGNMISVTRAAIGSYVCNFDIDFPTTDYAPLVLTDGGTVFAAIGGKSVSSCTINTRNSAGALVDPNQVTCVFIG